MHWYLAIIYEPEHVLASAPKPEPSAVLEVSEPAQETDESTTNKGESEDIEVSHVTSDDMVEEQLTSNMTQSLSIVSDGDVPDPKEIEAEEEPDVMIVDPPDSATKAEVVDAADTKRPASPMSMEVVPETPPAEPPKEIVENEPDVLNIEEGDSPIDIGDPSKEGLDLVAVPPDQFYGTAPAVSTRSGKQYQKPKPKPKRVTPVKAVYKPNECVPV